jgi:hypothetical protein
MLIDAQLVKAFLTFYGTCQSNYQDCMNTAPVRTENQVNPINSLLFYSINIYFSIILSSTTRSFKRSLSFGYIQGDSLARGPKLLSIKYYVIEIMT